VPPPLNTLCLYSTNPWVKWYICNKWRNDIHFVYCSPYFDPKSQGTDHEGSLIPPTSSRCAIYRDLAEAVRGPSFDRHNPKIISQQASLLKLIEGWRTDGSLSDDDEKEIVGLLRSHDYFIWRPILYIIPCALISTDRIELVPMDARAGSGPEYIIRDLVGTEFERIRFDAA
jgi:hypothetical protein